MDKSDRAAPPRPFTRGDVTALRTHTRELRTDLEQAPDDDLLRERVASLEALAAAIEREIDSALRRPFDPNHVAHLEDEVRVLRGNAEDERARLHVRQLDDVLRQVAARANSRAT